MDAASKSLVRRRVAAVTCECALDDPASRLCPYPGELVPMSESGHRDVLTVGQSIPVLPDQRTFSELVGMSQRCQTQTCREPARVSGRGRFQCGSLGAVRAAPTARR